MQPNASQVTEQEWGQLNYRSWNDSEWVDLPSAKIAHVLTFNLTIMTAQLQLIYLKCYL